MILRNKRAKMMLGIILCGIPPIICFYAILKCGLQIPYWDEWSWVEQFVKAKQGILTFQELWANHNEHRVFFPTVIALSLNLLTGYNERIILLVSFFHLLLVYMLFGVHLKSQHSNYLPILFCIGMIVFSLVQYENLLWGFQIGFIMCWFYIVLAIILFSFYLNTITNKKNQFFSKYRYLIGALFSAFIASFCSFQGLIVWIAIIASWIICYDTKIIKHNDFIVTICITICVYVLYFFKFQSDHAKRFLTNTFELLLEDPKRFSLTIISALNRFFFIDSDVAFGAIFIAVFLVATLIFIQKNKITLNKIDFVNVTLILFSFGFLISLIFGRGIYGIYAGRYTTFFNSFFIGILLFAFHHLSFDSFNGKNLLLSSTVVIVAISTASNYFGSINHYRNYIEELNYKNFVLGDFQSQSDKTVESHLYPSKKAIEANALYLSENKFSIFSDSKYWQEREFRDSLYQRLPRKGGLQCPLDINSISINDNEFSVNTWAIDFQATALCHDVYIDINGTLYNARYKRYRPDVAEFFSEQAYAYSGFERAFTPDMLKEGENPIKVVLVSQDKNYYSVIDSNIRILKSEGKLTVIN